MIKKQRVEIAETNPMIDYEVIGGPRHRIYALKDGQWMKCPTRERLIFEGPSIVWYTTATESCPGICNSATEYDVDARNVWGAIHNAICRADDVVSHLT